MAFNQSQYLVFKCFQRTLCIKSTSSIEEQEFVPKADHQSKMFPNTISAWHFLGENKQISYDLSLHAELYLQDFSDTPSVRSLLREIRSSQKHLLYCYLDTHKGNHFLLPALRLLCNAPKLLRSFRVHNCCSIWHIFSFKYELERFKE